MRAVLQRVAQASVTVGGHMVGSIGPGVCVLVGITHDDTQDDMEYMARKILGLRVFDDESGAPWKRSIQDCALDILCVSQFTLYAKTTKGSKPDFHQAMKSHQSRQFFDDFVDLLGRMYSPDRIQTGEFGAMMQVALVNDGPVTLELDSRRFAYTHDSADKQARLAKQAAKEQRRSQFAPAKVDTPLR
ncbi:D-tyrosyl-tRNA(Tyr) deacylase [Coemansia sp. Cherry 401B]|nr:D-tyrosyl-tRNA(Tyr) deacylase [Coemansia sp. Cherry 401B]